MRDDSETQPLLKIQRMVLGTPEKIFDLWARPELMARWMSPYPGEVRCEAEAEVRVGGSFKLLMRSQESECEIEGTYLEVERPHRLVFTWSGPPTVGVSTLVTLELKSTKTGTQLTLVHEKLPTPDVRRGHEMGWANMLDHLAVAVGSV
jgi:uncharacterized protein YndB with AHSA1/START domain